MSFFGEIHWAGLHRWWLVPLFLVAAVVIIYRYMALKKTLGLLAHSKRFFALFKHFSLRRASLKMILWLGVLFTLLVAILQPQWGKKEEIVAQEGRQLLIVFDISRSMLAQDVKPNRLTAAKFKVHDLLDSLRFEHVGLVLFSGSAALQCPLTRDYSAFLMFLDAVVAETVSPGTTAIDVALQKALSVYEELPSRKSKLILFVTDGEDFSTNLSSVKKKAEELGVTIIALGVGTAEGAPIPILDPSGKQIGHEVDEKGETILTKLNETLLHKLTNDFNGRYLRITSDDSDIKRISDFISTFEREELQDATISHHEDRYHWFLGAAWILLALEWLI